MIRFSLICFLIVINSICKANSSGEYIKLPDLVTLENEELSDYVINTIKIQEINLSWHETKPTINLKIKPSVLAYYNDSILLDTLFAVQTVNDYAISWFVDSVGTLVRINNNTFKVTTDSSLYLSISEANGCSYLETIKIAVKNSTGNTLYSESNFEIKLYPNPNRGRFKLSIRNAKPGIYDLKVNDTLGKQVYSREFNIDNLTDFFEWNLIPGFYIVTIHYNKAKISHLPMIVY
ncbi:T9SS type A sorting domain-containing protein [Saccharicrinis sp. FJH54]|uniref:T9SS type A sorting domain-containing protein n=1 Tax=Saccharicrinis sp. FJH54 TaxID=3344665 RepID=UPI0035D48CB2